MVNSANSRMMNGRYSSSIVCSSGAIVTGSPKAGASAQPQQAPAQRDLAVVMLPEMRVEHGPGRDGQQDPCERKRPG